eukprot:TRINITY_DN12691_c0_g2_i1.p1 TRINITY_DN12691_c0_g2~~TRINITY_DN12691_c0_g2_i1.p1  ORF type:complete len:135 (+),score=23.59 TRINITY_DN12691_c0_g2_i1:75-479(+)
MAVSRSDRRLQKLPDAFMQLYGMLPVREDPHLARSQSFGGYLTAEQDAVADSLVAFGGVRPLDRWLFPFAEQEEDSPQNESRTRLLGELQLMHMEMARRFSARQRQLRLGVDPSAMPAAWLPRPQPSPGQSLGS